MKKKNKTSRVSDSDKKNFTHEIIISLVAGVGTDLDAVINELVNAQKSHAVSTYKYL